MPKKNLSLLLPLAFAASTAHAQIDLIAIGQIDGGYQDLSARTAAPLENNVPGNRLGGIGSGLAYAGGNTFLALPDRGPNAVPYNANVDDTTTYIPRFQTFNLSLAVNPDHAPGTVGSMPYILSPALGATTLLSSAQPLQYAANGAPALNTANKFYFSGRSDNFAANQPSGSAANARLDPEGIRVSNDGKHVFITDEYGPYIYRFNRMTGHRVNAYRLPSYYAVAHPSSVGANEEAPNNTVGRIDNKGMEALAISPDGRTLIGMMQQNLLQDAKKYLRIIKIDLASRQTKEYAYKLTDGSSVSDILAINDHEFLVDERDGSGLGNGDDAVVKKLYKIDLSSATEITGTPAITAATPVVGKTLFLDIVAALTANGLTAAQVPAKIEGVAFGPDLDVNGVAKHTLFIANDNDFVPAVAGPNKIFVFAIDPSDLPNFQPQQIAPFPADKGDRG